MAGMDARLTGEVFLRDQTTRVVINPFCKGVTGPYTLASDTVPGNYTIVLNSATGLTVGDTIGLFQDSTDAASYFGKILSISTNTLTMDTPVDVIFETSRATLFELLCNMNVNGSVTPQIFTIDNNSTIPIDITRVIWHITDGSAMDDSLFGGITALTRGIVLRKKNADGSFYNLFNIKNNGEMGEIAYDKSYDSRAPAGVYGVSVRLTFGGQEKIGVVVRLKNGEELQLVVQDDLTGLSTFKMTAEGHYTQGDM